MQDLRVRNGGQEVECLGRGDQVEFSLCVDVTLELVEEGGFNPLNLLSEAPVSQKGW
jgi:hypothetical protein